MISIGSYPEKIRKLSKNWDGGIKLNISQIGKFELSVSFRCAWTSFLIFPNFSGLHSDQNMMKPQIKNSHKFVGIPLS